MKLTDQIAADLMAAMKARAERRLGVALMPSEENATACPCSTTTAPVGAAGAISVARVAAFDSPSAGASLAADALYRRPL